jgi:hypothetical protein
MGGSLDEPFYAIVSSGQARSWNGSSGRESRSIRRVVRIERLIGRRARIRMAALAPPQVPA